MVDASALGVRADSFLEPLPSLPSTDTVTAVLAPSPAAPRLVCQ
jgi:hypothetical protein